MSIDPLHLDAQLAAELEELDLPEHAEDCAVRFPLRSLADRLDITLGQLGGFQPGQLPAGMHDLADRLGIPVWHVKLLDRRGLSWEQADRYACAVGLHPRTVWPDWDRSAPGEEDLIGKRCRCPGPLRVPIGDECDRCGRHIGRRAA